MNLKKQLIGISLAAGMMVFPCSLIAQNGTDKTLASFEGSQDMPVLSPNNGCLVKVSQEKERASDGSSSLRVEFTPTK